MSFLILFLNFATDCFNKGFLVGNNHLVAVRQYDAVLSVLVGKLLCDVILTARHKARNGVMLTQHCNNLSYTALAPLLA